MEKKQSNFTNAVAMFVGTCINILISLISIPIITRLISPEYYGQWSLFTSYSTIGMAIIMMGLDQSLVRFYYKDSRLEFKRYLIFTVTKIPIIFGCIVIAITVPFINKLGLFDSKTMYFLLYINIILLIINKISHLVLRMEQKGIEYSSLIIINKIIFIIATFAMIYFRNIKQSIILILATIISQLIVNIVGIILGKEKWRLFSKKPENIDVSSKTLIIYGLPFIYALVATDIFNATDKWALNAMKTTFEVGIYSAAANIVAFCSIIKTTFDLLWAPMAMKHYENNPEDKTFYTNANGCITIVMFVFGILIIGFKDVIALLLGEKYRVAVSVVPLLLFNPIMTTVSETTVYGLNFKKKTWYHIIITTVSCTVNIILNMLLIPIYSSRGAALATAISYIVFFIMRTIMGRKVYKVNFNLDKFTIITTLFMIFALYNTFWNYGIFVNFMFMIFFLIIVLVLYKKYLFMLFDIVKNNLKLKKLKFK